MTSDFHVACRIGGEEVRLAARAYDAGRLPAPWFILAHGAGAGHDSPFIVSYARGLAARGITVITFNFPYTDRGRRIPDPPGTLEASWSAVIEHVHARAGGATRLVAGGKSMGGRIASQVAVVPAVASRLTGLVFLGYPLHPPGRPHQRRTAHWPDVRMPALFVQGLRDTFASPGELGEELPRFAGSTTVIAIPDADHSFKIPRTAGRPQEAVHADIQDAVAEWISRLAFE